nr:TRAP transporter large permease subunit [Ottowia sp.]
MTGSAIADAVSDCKILVPVMVKSGYSARFAAALSGATAVIAPIIPPSIPFIIYGPSRASRSGSCSWAVRSPAS